jgi:hypothetical protein
MSQQYQAGGQLHEPLGVHVEGNIVVAQGMAESPERYALRLVASDIGLQGVYAPGVIEGVLDEVDIGSIITTIARHF